MEDFLKKMIDGNGIIPPEACLATFNQNFEDAKNVDWFDKEAHYEAIFYRDNLEHIALFTITGELMEYKMYLPVDYLPEAIKNYTESKGEIMNSVLKNKGNTIEYEIIIRDLDLKRHLILMSDLGKVLEEKNL